MKSCYKRRRLSVLRRYFRCFIMMHPLIRQAFWPGFWSLKKFLSLHVFYFQQNRPPATIICFQNPNSILLERDTRCEILLCLLFISGLMSGLIEEYRFCFQKRIGRLKNCIQGGREYFYGQRNSKVLKHLSFRKTRANDITFGTPLVLTNHRYSYLGVNELKILLCRCNWFENGFNLMKDMLNLKIGQFNWIYLQLNWTYLQIQHILH